MLHCFVFMNGCAEDLKGQLIQKWKRSFTLMLFQTCITYFPLVDRKYDVFGNVWVFGQWSPNLCAHQHSSKCCLLCSIKSCRFKMTWLWDLMTELSFWGELSYLRLFDQSSIMCLWHWMVCVKHFTNLYGSLNLY